MAVVLALVSALAYGLSDFLGGVVGRASSAWRVAVVVQAVSTLSAAAVALLLPGTPSGADLAWAVLAGTGTGVGVGFLFRGLAEGRMSVVAPLSAVGAAVVPVGVGLFLGERPGPVVALALVAAGPGIWLVARSDTGDPGDPGDPGDRAAAGTAADRGSGTGVLDGVLAGLGFGVMFSAIGQVDESAGWWPIVLAQGVSTVVVALVATALGAAWRPQGPAWRAAPAGVLSTAALVTFQLATQRGLLTVSSVLASLYPAITVLLAVALLRERIHPSQALGLALCAVTVTLVALA